MSLRPTSAGFSIPGRRTARHSRPASKTWNGGWRATDELDDLSRRLDAVEHGPHGVFSPADGPVAGDGRFRLELRALELRLEQAESAALEGRDAVLAQLARMRLQAEAPPTPRDGADGDDPALEDPLPAGAEVVPFRGAEV